MLRSSGISQALELHYPKLNRLVKYNVVGAVKLLIASGAISGGYQADEFDIDRTTNSNSGIKAWKDYEDYVLIWLKEHVNDSDELCDARQFLLRAICDYWLKKAPRWPSVGEKGETFTMDLDYNGKILTDNYIYLWSVLGTIQMQDYRPSAKEFTATIWGDPTVTLKCVKMDKHELNKWVSVPFKTLQHHADKVSDKSIKQIASKLAAIKWD